MIMKTVAVQTPTWDTILAPICFSFGFLGFGCYLAIKVMPKISNLLAKIPIVKNASMQPRDQVHLLLMFASLWLFGTISSIENLGNFWGHAHGSESETVIGIPGVDLPFIGSHLLGAFAAGMAWVNVPRSHAIWTAQLKRLVKWMMRLFFAATIGFAVPVSKMMSGEAIWKGFVLGVLGPASRQRWSPALWHERNTRPRRRRRGQGRRLGRRDFFSRNSSLSASR